MNVIETEVKDVYIIEPQVFGDNRGWFMESWSQKKMEDAGLHYEFVQDNHSYSSQKGVLRGLPLYGVAPCWTWRWICAKAPLHIRNGCLWSFPRRITGSSSFPGAVSTGL